MQALSIVGPGASAVVADLAGTLDGRVATVDRRETVTTEAPDGGAGFELDADGNWSGSGTGRSFDVLLDSLAPEYDYALVAGFSKLRLPTVVLGESDPDAAEESVPGDVVAHAGDPTGLDIDSLAATLDEAEPYVTLEELVARAKRSPDADRCGAIATFTGRVRAKDSEDDSPTTHLAFEKYEGVAERKMAAIAAELEDREGVFEVLFHHRVGVVADGEDIVFVVVLAGHRTEAFRTVEDGINRLKDEVPLFKKETTVDEEFWVHDRS